MKKRIPKSSPLAAACGLLLLLVTIANGQESAEKVPARQWHPVAQEVKKQLGDYDKPFTLVVMLKAKPGSESAIVKAYQMAAGKTRKEEGNIQYTLNRPFAADQPMLLFERWKTIEALDDHLKQPYLVKMLEQLDEHLAEPPSLSVMRFQGLNAKLKKGKAAKDR